MAETNFTLILGIFDAFDHNSVINYNVCHANNKYEKYIYSETKLELIAKTCVNFLADTTAASKCYKAVRTTKIYPLLQQIGGIP